MQLQERGPLSLFSHESHVSFRSNWDHEITEHSICPPLIFFQTHLLFVFDVCVPARCMSPSISLHHHPSWDNVRMGQRGLLNLCVWVLCGEVVVIICLFPCQRSSLTSWIIENVIIPSMNTAQTKCMMSHIDTYHIFTWFNVLRCQVLSG